MAEEEEREGGTDGRKLRERNLDGGGEENKTRKDKREKEFVCV